MNKELEQVVNPDVKSKLIEDNPRISRPALQVSKIMNVLLYILEHCAGKPNVEESVLGT